VALSAGFVTRAAWLILGAEFDFSLERMVTVMVISCPHALGLAIPLVVAISTAVSANLILFGKATYRKMIQNLIWATGYNIIALPLAAGVLYNQGIMISPAVGAALMSLSTVIVAVNAQLLKRSIIR
jgi:cation transport ATPase